MKPYPGIGPGSAASRKVGAVHSDVFTVLVVCQGNVNRSALGAVLLETWAHWYLPTGAAERVRVTSAGLGAPVGSTMGRRARVIAEALGADGSRHRAAQITEAHIRAADLVLVSSSRQRNSVLALVPGALARTFTIREAGRIAAALPEWPAPRSLAELRARVLAIADNRIAGERRDDDIVDPQGKDDEAYRQMAREEVPPLAELAGALFGMPPGEIAAYGEAVEVAHYEFPPSDAASTRSPGRQA
ncbi:arsenate reductase/protein-tyrosine-phosphatase family protein [Agromyces bauzanensis]